MYQDTSNDEVYAAAKIVFGRNVKRVRKLRKLSQEELGLRISADQAYISRIESGSLNPTLESIVEIAEALNAKITELFKS